MTAAAAALIAPAPAEPARTAPGPARTAPGTHAHGRAEIGFRLREGATALGHLHQVAPLRVLLPRPPRDDITTAVIATTSGGLVGGDSLGLTVSLDAGVRTLVLPQAAEKLYGQSREDVDWRTTLEAGDGAWLEALPMATILFDGARLARRTEVRLEGAAEVMTGDMLVFGRLARGERFAHGRLDDRWEILRDGRLIWADRLDLGPDPAAALAHPAGLGSAAALGTLLYAGPSAAALLDMARALDPGPEVRLGATRMNEILVVRLLSASPWALRRAYETLWCRARALAAGLPERLPAVWHC